MENTKEYRAYKITSVNTPLFFVGSCNNPKRYLSQLLHNHIKACNQHIIHNKKYSTCYYIIHANDVSIELIDSYDSLVEMKYAIDNIIKNDLNCINQLYHLEITNKVLKSIRTTLKQNKQTKERKQQYFKDYYEKNKANFVKPEQQKQYYENNKAKVSARNKERYEKRKKARLENEKL